MTSSCHSPYKLKNIYVIIDNRHQHHQNAINDFRCSAFKQTEIDPMESRCDLPHYQEAIMQQLAIKMNQLEQRVLKLEQQQISIQPRFIKKYRRKALQIQRNYKCPLEGCLRKYGSPTSLRKHMRVKHDGC